MCRLTTLNGQRARILFRGGLESVSQVASARSEDIEVLLLRSAPFESGKVNQAVDADETESDVR